MKNIRISTLLAAAGVLLSAPLSSQNIYLRETFDTGVVPPLGWFQEQSDPNCAGWFAAYDQRAGWAHRFGSYCDDILWAPVDLSSATAAYVHFDAEIWYAEARANHPFSAGDGKLSLVIRYSGATNWYPIWEDCRVWDRRDMLTVEVPQPFLGRSVDIGVRCEGANSFIFSLDFLQVDDSPVAPFWVDFDHWPNPPLPTTVAAAPYFQDFESGIVPPEMSTVGLSAFTWQPDPIGWCEIANTAGTYNGNYVLEMGTAPGSFGLAAGVMVVKLDLSSLSHPIIRFAVNTFGAFPHNEDGVYLSNDGNNWVEVFDNWSSLPYGWSIVTIDISDAFVDFQQPVYVKFFFVSDFWPYGTLEGVAIDDLSVEDAVNGCQLELRATGSCLSRYTLEVENAVPGGSVALLYGPSGSFTQGGVPCTGIVLDIQNPRLGAMWDPASGIECMNLIPAPVSSCGVVVQAVDLTTCCVSNAVAL